MDMAYLLPVTWAVVIAFGIAMYVLLDGFDLGVGILFPIARSDRERDIMMNSVAPVWDGNETWLVLGGGGLFVAFPLAYALLMPALYLVVLFMLIALIFRGVAFEFRFKAPAGRRLWDWSFTLGSTLAALAQGVMLGAFIQGFQVDLARRAFVGGPFDWLTPFSLFTGLSLVAGYAALGAGWLIIKTEGELQQRAYRLMLPLAGVLLALIAGVSAWTPFLSAEIYDRWFSTPNIYFLAPLPLAVIGLGWALARTVRARREIWPFVLTMGLFVLSYGGLAVSLWPYIVPRDVTIWQAAAPVNSQVFILIGALIVMPLVLAYTGYTYWIFRGKAGAADGYH